MSQTPKPVEAAKSLRDPVYTIAGNAVFRPTRGLAIGRAATDTDAFSLCGELNRLLSERDAALAAVRELREAANGLLAWWDCEDRSLTAVEAARLSTEYMHTLRTALANTKDIA